MSWRVCSLVFISSLCHSSDILCGLFWPCALRLASPAFFCQGMRVVMYRTGAVSESPSFAALLQVHCRCRIVYKYVSPRLHAPTVASQRRIGRWFPICATPVYYRARSVGLVVSQSSFLARFSSSWPCSWFPVCATCRLARSDLSSVRAPFSPVSPSSWPCSGSSWRPRPASGWAAPSSARCASRCGR